MTAARELTDAEIDASVSAAAERDGLLGRNWPGGDFDALRYVYRVAWEARGLEHPPIVYVQCREHAGMSYTLRIGTAPFRKVCPICEPDAAP